MRRTTTFAVSTALLPCVLALAACGSSGTASASGGSSPSAAASSAASSAAPANAGLSESELQSQITAAAATATALLLKGTINSDGTAVTIDAQLNKASSKGTLTAQGMAIPFICVGAVCYIQFTASLMKTQKISTTSTAGKLMLGKWVSTTSSIGKPLASALADFKDLGAFSAQLGTTTDPGETITAAGTTTFDGQTVAVYKDVDPGNGDTEMYIPASGVPLPLEEVGVDGNTGTITFTWNQPTAVKAPTPGEMFSA